MSLIDMVKRNDKSISEINIRDPFEKNHFHSLCEVLKKNETVHVFHAHTRAVGDEEAKWIAEMLTQNTALKTLQLFFCGIGTKGAKAIAEALERNNTVCTLNFGFNYIGDGGAKAIAEMLKRNISLRTLNLNYNPISSVGIKPIADALHKNNTLVALSLRCGETKELKAVAEMLKKNDTLRTLELGSKSIGTQGAVKLKMGLRKNIAIQIFSGDVKTIKFASDLVDRNRLLRQWNVDKIMQNLFAGVHAAFGSDVYTCLLVADCFPYFALLNRARKVAYLQSCAINFHSL